MRSLLLAIVLLSGCGQVRATVGVVDASRAVQEAREAGAAEHAEYPLVLAEQLLAKAVEEKGYAEWEQAFLLANEATKRANEATELSRAAAAPPLWPEANLEPEPAPAVEPDPAAEPAPAVEPDPAAEPAEPAPSDDDDSAAPIEEAPPAEEGAKPTPWGTE